ncbi:MAG: diguanylate cyclase [Bryobacteraceae bacterium]|jgi:diguanylate cyclase (GGDEF)-like protein/PAS domain S-box-containing protein
MASVTGSEDPSAGFFETARDLLHVASPEGIFVTANSSFTRVLGYSGAALHGTAFIDLVPRDEAPAVVAALQTLAEGNQTVAFECRCRAADGSHPVLQWSVSKHAATGVRYWIGRDVTEHKRVEALLAGQAKAIDVSQAVIEFGMDGTIIAANERFLALMEYRAEDLIGRHHRILVQSEYANSPEYCEFWRALRRGQFQAGEFQRFTRHGQPVWMQATYTPILGLDGEPEKVVKFATSITERIAAERQLQTLNGTLSRSLALSRQRDADNAVLSEITAFLQASLTEDEVVDLVRRYIDRLSGNATAAVYFFAAVKEGERQAAARDTDELGQTLLRTDCWALRRGVIHTRLAGAMAPMCKHFSANVSFEAASTCVPIFANGVLAGMLTAFWTPREPDELQAAEHERTQSIYLTLAGRVGSAFEAIRLRSQLEEESIRDGLTGLYNRRYLDNVLRRELEQAHRLQMPVSAIMLDIDRFKMLNDTYGHEMGDRALRAVAQTISDTVRHGDIVCRYGGEEFAVLFVGASLDNAAMKAEAVRAAVACLEIGGHGDGPIMLTISAGVSEAAAHPLDGVSLLRRADRALYCAKEEGRNLVRVYADRERDHPAAPSEGAADTQARMLSNLSQVLAG